MLGGRTVADLGRSVLVVLAGLAAGLAVGFRFHTGFLPSLAGIGLVLAFAFAMSWWMAWIALKVKDPETAQVAGFLPLVPFVFASSGFVPVATMPGWLQGFAKAQPISVTISAIRALTQGGPTRALRVAVPRVDRRHPHRVRRAGRQGVPQGVTAAAKVWRVRKRCGSGTEGR